MKYYFILLIVIPFTTFSQINFDSCFYKKSLRIDFELAGSDNHEFALLKQMKEEPYWGGNPSKTIEKQNKGDYHITMHSLNGDLLFSRGFNSLFREWQTTNEAKNIKRGFYHTMQLPFPKNQVTIEVSSRQKNGSFSIILQKKVNPQDYFISPEKTTMYPIDTVTYSGSFEDNLDIVFIAEGYTQKQMDKFQKDVRRFKKWIFDVVPFSEYRDKVNIYAILSPSKDINTDVPGEYIYKETLLNSSFYTFNSPRYLTVKNTKKMYDIAAQVPYDHVYVIVNTDIYGGAGFYNTYTCCAADCDFAQEIASHELGHGLVGLADEYYDNSNDEVSYYYNLSIEPWEPNLTTLVDFSAKWKSLVDKKTPIPTSRIEKYEKVIGAFQGGSYQSKGIYSPMQDCKMKSNTTKFFCPACKKAIHETMKYYIKSPKD